MARRDVAEILSRGDALAIEMEQFVPQEPRTTQFRADLAGLLVVSIAASYEACVKEVLMSFAGRHHAQFENFTRNQYARLNSRISIPDLYNYTKTFDNGVHVRFGQLMTDRKAAIQGRTGKDIAAAYKQLLSWRHDFAHANVRNTTIEEALVTHRLAKRVLYIFDEAFSSTLP